MTKTKFNWDNEVTQKSAEEQQKEVMEAKRKYMDKTSALSDKYDPSTATIEGKVKTWEKIYKYKGIAFKLIIMKYFNLQNGFKSLNDNKICDEYVLVEYPEETKELIDVLKTFDFDYFNEFLYHDTLHSWNMEQTLNEQLQTSYDNAIHDIDTLAKTVEDGLSEEQEGLKGNIANLKKILAKTDIKISV